MKRLILLIAVLFALSGCTLPGSNIGTLILSAPDSAYPPCDVTLVASGVTGGQYTFTIEGKTYTQTGNSLTVTIENLPCTVEVLWESEAGDYQTATVRIGLANTGPVIGRPVLNGIDNLWWIHPRAKYIVTFPYASDSQGGDVTLVNVTVFNTGQGEENSVFCPPYEGMNPPKPDVYHVETGQGTLENAFVFFSLWNGAIDSSVNNFPEWKAAREYFVGDEIQRNDIGYRCKRDTSEATSTRIPGTHSGYWVVVGPVIVGTDRPYSPPDWPVDSYPGAGTTCLEWPRDFIPSGMTVITATFEDEMGATTTESWSIPTTSYPGC